MTQSDQPILEYSGSFRLLRKIATGGMATVYEAEHLGPDGFAKRVALKAIHPRYAREAEWLQLFIAEAKLSANLVHGNIVQIYQLGEVEGQYYMTMEYISGPTLRAVIDRHRSLGRPVPVPLAAYIASRVCRALDFAHNFTTPAGQRLDIVHRDVSPGNIMATWDGHIKLADFGIAKARTSVDPAARGALIMGKKHYMSPEQLLALDVDARSDVFCAGLVLFELLSLDPLFTEDDTRLVIDEVTYRPLPSVRALLPDCPPAVEAILTAALSREPGRRPTAAAMGRELDRWCEAQPVVSTPDRLQEHLATLFRVDASAPERRDEATRFSNLARGLGARRRARGWLRRLAGR